MSFLKNEFEKAAENNLWADADSLSGPGSNLHQTRVIRKALPELYKQFQVKKILDAPCGDFFWVKEIKEPLSKIIYQYIGGDIVPQLIKKNTELFSDDRYSFKVIDITKDSLPVVDLIFTRDCFIHLSYYKIYLALKNFKKSGAEYLLVSTYTKRRKNFDVEQVYLPGRALNLQTPPFNFPQPITLINEGCTEGGGEYSDKSLGLWRLRDLTLFSLLLNITASKPSYLLNKILKKARNFGRRFISKN